MKNKLKDNEIIKALECCAEDKCSQCPLQDGVCSEKYVMKESHDIITRQQAEIKALKKVVAEDFATEYDNKIKSEAVKEFVDRLCNGRVSSYPVVITMKCLLKEMESGINLS